MKYGNIKKAWKKLEELIKIIPYLEDFELEKKNPGYLDMYRHHLEKVRELLERKDYHLFSAYAGINNNYSGIIGFCSGAVIRFNPEDTVFYEITKALGFYN